MLLNQSNEPIKVQITDEIAVTILPNQEHEFLITSTELASTYGVTDKALSHHKTRNEFVEGVHFFKIRVLQNGDTEGRLRNLTYNRIFWTKRGVVRMGFLLNSPRAKLIRDWAESALIEKLQGIPVESKQQFILPDVIAVKPAKPIERVTPEYDRELVEILVGIEDAKTRTKLFTKLKKGGLL